MKFLILTTRRTGSTFLVDCLNSHPQIKCSHEVLYQGFRDITYPWPLHEYNTLGKLWRYYKSGAYNPRKILDEFYALDDAPVKGFKAMYHQLKDLRARKYLVNDTSIRIIHLRRDNLLKRYVSEVLTTKRQGKEAWHTYKKIPVVTTKISIDDAIKAMRVAQQEYNFYDDLFSKHPKIQLSYENIVDDQYLSDEATRRIANFLEVEVLPMKSKLVKTNPNDLSKIIENYDQLSRALQNTGFARYIDSE